MNKKLIILAIIISFLAGILFNKFLQPCKYYVWQNGEKHCITKEVKQYIENVEMGDVNRLKSKRGVKIEP